MRRSCIREDNHPTTIRCQTNQVLDIRSARYGVLPPGNDRCDFQGQPWSCEAGNSFGVVKSMCQVQNSCTPFANVNEFQVGHCNHGQVKYLEVQYKCLPDTMALHHHVVQDDTKLATSRETTTAATVTTQQLELSSDASDGQSLPFIVGPITAIAVFFLIWITACVFLWRRKFRCCSRTHTIIITDQSYSRNNHQITAGISRGDAEPDQSDENYEVPTIHGSSQPNQQILDETSGYQNATFLPFNSASYSEYDFKAVRNGRSSRANDFVTPDDWDYEYPDCSPRQTGSSPTYTEYDATLPQTMTGKTHEDDE